MMLFNLKKLYSVLLFVLLAPFHNAEEALCPLALDIVQVQDMTSSFDHLWGQMQQQVNSMVKLIKNVHSDSYYAIMTFGDKNVSGPFPPDPTKTYYLGYTSDYCARLDIPLSPYDKNKMNYIFTEYAKTFEGGGGDWPEATLEAVYRALIGSKVNWRKQSSTGGPVSKVIVLVTDATSHMPGDVQNLTSQEVVPFYLPEYLKDENANCSTMDYPSVKQVADKLSEHQAQLIVLVSPGGVYDENGNFQVTYSLANYGKKYHNENGLKLWYQDQFAAVGLKDVIIELLDSDMKAYSIAFKKALTKFADKNCKVEPINVTEKENKSSTEQATTETASNDKLTSQTSDESTTDDTADVEISTPIANSTSREGTSKQNNTETNHTSCETEYIIEVEPSLI